MSSLSYGIEARGGNVCAVLKGEITEEADLRPLADTRADVLILDLEAISRVNSCGVREWVAFVRACNQGGMRLTVRKCSPAVVAQLNTISNFVGVNGVVESVYAPYFCGECSTDQLVLLELRPGVSCEVKEELPCPHCGGKMEFDDLPETYLQFQVSPD